jgi:uncharacterized membrane protein YcaP (DUF421 family)
VDLFHLSIPPWELIVRTITIDIVLLAALRLFGKRELGQFTLYDLILILLVANAVQPAMTGPDTSLTGGFVIIGGLVLFNWVLGKLDGLPFFHRLLVPEPRVLIRNGTFINNALSAEGVDRDEAEMAMREHGIDDVRQVRLGVLEPDGSISIVPRAAPTLRTRRVVRYVHHG